MRGLELTGYSEANDQITIRAQDDHVEILRKSEIILSGNWEIVKDLFFTLIQHLVLNEQIHLTEE